MAKSVNERVKKLREERKKAGLNKAEYYLSADEKRAVDGLIEKLRKK